MITTLPSFSFLLNLRLDHNQLNRTTCDQFHPSVGVVRILGARRFYNNLSHSIFEPKTKYSQATEGKANSNRVIRNE